MNWKKLIIGITLVNLLGWGLIELYSRRYAGSNISFGAGLLIFIQLVGYYIVTIASRIKLPHNKLNCQHDWHPDTYNPDIREKCILCGAERGKIKYKKYATRRRCTTGDISP